MDKYGKSFSYNEAVAQENFMNLFKKIPDIDNSIEKNFKEIKIKEGISHGA